MIHPKTNIDPENLRPAIIYRLSAGDKHYYGATVLPLIQRVQIHTRDNCCQSYKQGISTSKDLKWEVVEITTQELRLERENYYIRNFPCVNILGRDTNVPQELKEQRRVNSKRWRSKPENREKVNKKKREKREEMKKQELEKKHGIKIKQGIILDRPMHENVPNPPSDDNSSEASNSYEGVHYTPFGVNNPDMNELYQKHKDYIEKKVAELAWKSKEQTYHCSDCNKNLASSAPVVLRRHFCSYKHLINSFQMETSDKPVKERKPYTRKTQTVIPVEPSATLKESFQQSIEEGYVFN